MLLRRGCTWLTLMPLLLSLSTGELSFYRDALPETSEDIALKHLVRYLETQRLQQRLHRSHLFLSPMHKKHMMQSPRDLLDALTNKVALEKLRQQKLKTWTRHRQHQYQDSINQVVPERNYLLPYYDLDFELDYPGVKASKDDGLTGPKDYGDSFGYGYRDDAVRYKQMFDKGVMEKLTLDFHNRYMDRDHTDVLHEGAREAAVHSPAALSGPEFTYKFDNSNLEEKHPFAVKPNDPRYFSDASFSFDDSDRQDASGVRWKEKNLSDEEREPIKHEDNTRELERKTAKDSTADALEMSAARHPLIVPINHDLNTDIYFIAIVAGCSAAAMFALVLIALTWCRLQRGAKAAADIEYPAYGVTGPNKDVSPSGDQRLAQSAQMYHFQHQKQQIIAMENRTSATRDPGSLSEAESDEENEEGDYTVYECPGLASTGEMEVKNPMFHDDPTPATPAQGNNKDGDHI